METKTVSNEINRLLACIELMTTLFSFIVVVVKDFETHLLPVQDEYFICILLKRCLRFHKNVCFKKNYSLLS